MFKNYNFKSLSCTDILFFLALTNTTLWGYVKIILSRLPIIGSISNVLTATFVIALIIICTPKFFKILKPVDYIFYFACLITYLLQYIIYPQNTFYLDESINIFLLKTLPFYFIGRIINYDKTAVHINLISIISIICSLIIVFVINNNDNDELNVVGHMGSAYILLPFIQLMILDAFKTNKVSSIVLSIISFIYLLSLGNRGSVLYLTIYIIICFLKVFKKQSIYKKSILILVIIFLFIYITSIKETLYSLFIDANMSTRVFDMMSEDGINTSGRDNIAYIIFEHLSNNWSGFGLTGDRLLLNGAYSHNIFIELLFSFGYIFGGLIIILLISSVIKAIQKCKNTNNELFYWSLICFGLLPLMTSQSFLFYPNFFLLIGYTVQINTNKVKNNIIGYLK